ncbi:MAG: phosphatase PAP2 family protein [Anaerolineae bacterium]|nr:MAG: phosphatase PAP2 family protein [Anaerolineae bacterium]
MFQYYLIAIVLVYWCLNKRLGATLFYLMTLSISINSLLKHALRDPRPYWLVEDIALKKELTYGVPSGHAQNATVFYGTIALWFRRSWIWLLSILMILLMALSRVYLGVHDIEDVLAGTLVGVLILIAYYFWQRLGESWFKNRILGQRLLIAIILPLILGAIYITILILTTPAAEDSPWFQHVDNAEIESYQNFALSITGLIGLSIGLILEGNRVRFLVSGPFWKRFLRFLVGLSGVLILWFGLGEIFPEEPVGVAITFSSFRFLLMILWIAYYAPLLFTRIRLAEQTPEPDSLLFP